MPKASEMIPSKFLRKEDIEDDLVVSCKAVTLEEMPGDQHESRWVLQFKELPKGLVLNATTIRVLAKAFGDDTNQWAGKKVTLYVDPNVSFKGQVVGGLRLRPMKPPKPVATAAAVEELSDEIPF